MTDDPTEALTPDDRSFFGSLDDTMDHFETMDGMVKEEHDRQVEMLTGRYSRWSPEMRLGAMLVLQDINEQWAGALAMVEQLREQTGGDTECDSEDCPIHGDSTATGIAHIATMWVNVSMRVRAGTEAIVEFDAELQETSERLHRAGYGRHNDD